MLTIAADGVHAMPLSGTSDQVSLTEISNPHQAPCSPLEQNHDYDGCNHCVTCACHAPLMVQSFQLVYSPTI